MLLVSRGKTPFLSTLLFSCFLLFSACQKDAVADLAEAPIVPEERSYPGVDERLWPYFQRFEEAGIERGFDVDLVASRITGVIENLDGEHVAGQCTTFGSFRFSCFGIPMFVVIVVCYCCLLLRETRPLNLPVDWIVQGSLRPIRFG